MKFLNIKQRARLYALEQCRSKGNISGGAHASAEAANR